MEDVMEEEYHSDYPSVPTNDRSNPYYMCAHCGETDPAINGRIEGHAEWCEYRIRKEAEVKQKDNINHKILARNIRHRLADMLGSQWNGALDAAMDEMLLEEIDRFDIIQILPAAEKLEEGPGPFCTASGKDIDPMAWPLRKRDKNVDPYLKGIMDKKD